MGEAQKSFGGNPKVLRFCINIGELDVENGAFPSNFREYIVRRTISFCNKELQVFVGESLVECFKFFAMDQLNVNYFVFSLCPLTMRSF